MIDQLLRFLQNKYFLSILGILFAVILIFNIANYFSERGKEQDFFQFIKLGELISSDASISQIEESENWEFRNFGYSLLSKSIVAKKALDQENYIEASRLYSEIINLLKSSNTHESTKLILLDQYLSNYLRVLIQLEDFETGSLMIKESDNESVVFFEVAGDFYSHFNESVVANEFYDKAINLAEDEASRNILKLKKL